MLKMYERDGRNTSSNDPKMMEARVFIGNLPSESVTRQAVEQRYKEYGKILGISMHKSYGFVQFDNEDSAKTAVKATHGTMMSGKMLGE
jgi:RNA recognition motif-containing protein